MFDEPDPVSAKNFFAKAGRQACTAHLVQHGANPRKEIQVR